jgi:hypothetical protein
MGTARLLATSSESLAAAAALAATDDDWDLLECAIEVVDENVLRLHLAQRDSRGARCLSGTPLLYAVAGSWYRHARISWPDCRRFRVTVSRSGEYVALLGYGPVS